MTQDLRHLLTTVGQAIEKSAVVQFSPMRNGNEARKSLGFVREVRGLVASIQRQCDRIEDIAESMEEDILEFMVEEGT